MFLLAQNKEKIINLNNITTIDIARNIGGKKDEKFSLMVNASIIALYPDKETAQKTLVKILAAVENDEKVYELE